MHNDISSSDKVHQLLSSHIQIHPHIGLELAWKRCLICSYSSPDSDKTTFFSLEKAILLDPYFSLKAMVWSYKHINGGFVSNKHSAFHCNWWTGEVWTACGLLWCLDSHSDGTHSLQMIHWRASHGMHNFPQCILMKKQTPLHLVWPEGVDIFSKFSF